MILVQFVVIAILVGALSNEYLSNDYYRAWINSNYAWLGFLLQGQADALLVGIAFGATALLIMTVRNDRQSDPAVEFVQYGLSQTVDDRIDMTDNDVPARSKQDAPDDVMVELERHDN